MTRVIVWPTHHAKSGSILSNGKVKNRMTQWVVIQFGFYSFAVINLFFKNPTKDVIDLPLLLSPSEFSVKFVWSEKIIGTNLIGNDERKN